MNCCTTKSDANELSTDRRSMMLSNQTVVHPAWELELAALEHAVRVCRRRRCRMGGMGDRALHGSFRLSSGSASSAANASSACTLAVVALDGHFFPDALLLPARRGRGGVCAQLARQQQCDDAELPYELPELVGGGRDKEQRERQEPLRARARCPVPCAVASSGAPVNACSGRDPLARIAPRTGLHRCRPHASERRARERSRGPLRRQLLRSCAPAARRRGSHDGRMGARRVVVAPPFFLNPGGTAEQ